MTHPDKEGAPNNRGGDQLVRAVTVGPDQSPAPEAGDEYDFDYDDDDNSDCWNCGGEGFVSNCFQEFACMYPDEGCRACRRRCTVCSPLSLQERAEQAGLRRTLAEALAKACPGAQPMGVANSDGAALHIPSKTNPSEE